MRIVRALCLASVGAAVLSARVAGAQDTREVVLRLHRAGDTVSIRGAAVTIDHTIEAGNTDSAGIVRIPDLLDGGHIIEVVARGYQAYFDNFNTSANAKQPIQFELLPILATDTAKTKGQKTDPRRQVVHCGIVAEAPQKVCSRSGIEAVFRALIKSRGIGQIDVV